jgi:glucose-6-phosphate isomerase
MKPPVRAQHPLADQQTLLVANALAQAQALLVGRGAEALRRELGAQGMSGAALDAAVAARECPGNRASTTILLPTLDALNLGALLALYEHRTFVESVLLGINAFDQWGVELGKSLAQPIVAALAENRALPESTDPSTQALVHEARKRMRDPN